MKIQQEKCIKKYSRNTTKIHYGKYIKEKGKNAARKKKQ